MNFFIGAGIPAPVDFSIPESFFAAAIVAAIVPLCVALRRQPEAQPARDDQAPEPFTELDVPQQTAA